jgi:hypothetical protein
MHSGLGDRSAMPKYTPLRDNLSRAAHDSITLSFSDIEKIIGTPLPKSAHKYREWWSNEADGRHVQAHSWMEAGYRVDDVNQTARRIRFVKA